MLSAVGTGSILFTPRVASEYKYQLLWLLLLVVFFMWVMIREMARFSIVTGKTMLEGMHTLEGPRGWAVWLVFVPQLLAASVGIAGLSAIVGSALQSFLPGSAGLYGVLTIALSTAFIAGGQYMLLEKSSRIMALLLMVMVIVAAVVVGPDLAQAGEGLFFTWPDSPDLYIILPWVGTILAGSMGIVWFGYWTATRGFGGGLVTREPNDEEPDQVRAENRASEDEDQDEATRVKRLRDWVGLVTGTAALGVLGGLLVIFSFMVLGAELLAPEGKLPEGADVAVDLTSLFSSVWGTAGEYLLLAAIIIALGGSVLANQDGWGRSFADMTLILSRAKRDAGKGGWAINALSWLEERTGLPIFERRYLKRLFVILVTGIVPIIIILLFDNPVTVMSASGIIAALHTPFIALTALYINCTRLPKQLRPGLFIVCCMGAAGLFYLGFAGVYLWDLVAGGGG
jgi:Mn2+/Fe2+ NRAMP family transporter